MKIKPEEIHQISMVVWELILPQGIIRSQLLRRSQGNQILQQGTPIKNRQKIPMRLRRVISLVKPLEVMIMPDPHRSIQNRLTNLHQVTEQAQDSRGQTVRIKTGKPIRDRNRITTTAIQNHPVTTVIVREAISLQDRPVIRIRSHHDQVLILSHPAIHQRVILHHQSQAIAEVILLLRDRAAVVHIRHHPAQVVVVPVLLLHDQAAVAQVQADQAGVEENSHLINHIIIND